MPLGLRRVIFYFFVLVFLFIGASLVLYSQGYRFDFRLFKVEKIGGIFVKSAPEDASITLNQKPIQNKSWLLQSGTLINDLTPGNYHLVLAKSGYHTWTKDLVVEPSIVTEADFAVLLKDTPPKNLKNGAADFWLQNSVLVYKNEKNKLSYVPGGSDEKVITTGDDFVSLKDEGGLMITKNSSSSDTFFVIDATKTAPLNVNTVFNKARAALGDTSKKTVIKRVDFDPTDSQRLLVLTDKGVYLLGLQNSSLRIIYGSEPKFFSVTSDGAMWQNAKQELVSFGSLNNGLKTIGAYDDNIIAVDQVSASPSNLTAVLQSNGTFSISGGSIGEKKTIADKAALMKFSPDQQKLAFIDHDGKINIMYFYDKKKSKASYRLPDIKKMDEVESFVWYKDSNHLLVRLVNGKLYFTENDDRLPLNAEVISENVKKYFYDAGSSSVFFLKDADLFQFVF